METIAQFAGRIKAKYPDYKDVPDADLVLRIVAKHPEYKDSVSLDESPQQPKAIRAPQASQYSNFSQMSQPPSDDFGAGRPVADVAKLTNNIMNIPAGMASGLVQGFQDKGNTGAGYGQAGLNLLRAGADPFRVGPNRIQSPEKSLERMGVPNEQSQSVENLPTYGMGPGVGMAPQVRKQMGSAQVGGLMAEMVSPSPFMAIKPVKTLAGLQKGLNKGFARAEKIAEIPNKYAGKIAQEMSMVSEDALRMAGTKEGRELLKANAGKENEIGQKLVEMMNSPETYAPNKAKFDLALSNMGDVDIMPVIKALQETKIKRSSGKILPHEQVANDAIQEDINALLGSNGKTSLPAPEALNLRQGMDKNIDFNSPEGKILNEAKKTGRLAFKNLLIDKAKATGNTEYITQMESWSKQLDARDRLEHFLGKNKESQQDRAEAFVHNLWGKNKKNRQKVMSDIGEVFGSDFVNESKLANLSAQLGPEGTLANFSRASTGKAKLGGIVGLPFSSPKLAAKVTLPIASMPPKVFKWLKNLTEAKSAQDKAFYTENLVKAGMDEAQIQDVVKMIPPPEIEKQVSKVASNPMEAQNNYIKRIKAQAFLKDRDGVVPDNKSVYAYLNELGEKDVPKIPEKPKATREFKERRLPQDIALISRTMKEGLEGYETVTTTASQAPASFFVHGTELKRVKGKYDNIITYKDKFGQKHEFRGDETIHMDPPKKDEVPF